MIKINNPYNLLDKHLCFGCSDKNPIGLKLNFTKNGDTIAAVWKPNEHYQGFYQVLHGGIQATLLDEVAGWVVQVVCQTSGVTSEMRVTYHKPVSTSDEEIRIEARILQYRDRYVDIEAALFNAQGLKCTTALVTYFLFPENVAKEKLYYPGKEAFL